MSDANSFMRSVLIFIDRNGTVIHKNSNPMLSQLSMKYDKQDLKAEMSVTAHAMGNGSCSAKIEFKGEIVYAANGNYTANPFNVKETVNKSGNWKSLIKS